MDRISQQSQAPFNNLFLQENGTFKSRGWKRFSLVKQKQDEETLAARFLHAALSFTIKANDLKRYAYIYTFYIPYNSKNSLPIQMWVRKTDKSSLCLPRGPPRCCRRAEHLCNERWQGAAILGSTREPAGSSQSHLLAGTQCAGFAGLEHSHCMCMYIQKLK